MVSTFRSLYGLREGLVTEAESTRMRELVESKYSSDEWLHRVP
jgi:lipoate-protein ligase A